MYEPLRIRAYLQTGIISDQFLPLDGVLYYHKVREEMGEEIITKPLESSVREYQHISLPFTLKMKDSEAHFYSCSFAVWSPDMVEDQQTYSKRFDLKYSDMIDFGKKLGKIETARGRYKMYHIKVYYRTATYVEWYAHGWKDDIEKLLKFVTHLGKKTSQGWGAVLKWEVESWKEDWSVRGFEDNRLMRAVPVKQNGFLYGVRPSYWNPKHQFPCLMPTMKGAY
jgi:CRISPR type IV-associated protein Csf3